MNWLIFFAILFAAFAAMYHYTYLPGFEHCKDMCDPRQVVEYSLLKCECEYRF